jgi:hypothetical protein
MICSVVMDEYVRGVVGGDIADTAVMSALARRYGMKKIIFMPPSTDALDSAQGSRRRPLRRCHIAPEGIGGRPKSLCILATHVHCQHFGPVVPFTGCITSCLDSKPLQNKIVRGTVSLCESSTPAMYSTCGVCGPSNTHLAMLYIAGLLHSQRGTAPST